MKIFAVRLKELRNEGATHYPEVPNLLKLADFFEVSTDYLLGRSNEREMKP